MRKALRSLIVAAIVASGAFGTGIARADVDSASGTNVQEGDNRETTNQGGRSASGDAVGGQVAGVVSSGRTSVDATNVSRDSSVESGEASGSNTGRSFTGLNRSLIAEVGEFEGSDVTDVDCAAEQVFGCNIQEGDNSTTLTQTVAATTGDGVAGQVIGAVTAAGGSASIVAANSSNDVDVTTGDAEGENDANAFTGLVGAVVTAVGSGPELVDVTDTDCVAGAGCNIQEGDNRTTARQAANASTGDGVAGQVIGAVSAGATSIDATNRSDGVSVDTGDADATNGANAFTGHSSALVTLVGTFGTSDLSAADCDAGCNLQDGDNRTSLAQSAGASSGDGVAGEVIGAVTAAGGSASIVAANTSTDSDVTTGDADSANGANALTGHNDTLVTIVGSAAADVEDAACFAAGFGCNIQEGDNRTTARQAANASTGDGVAGQVIGAVSAGATSIDATNRSDGVSVDTGDADATNDANAFTGHLSTLVGVIGSLGAADVGATDCESGFGCNLQDGDNRTTLGQSASATSGDGVGGQVVGAVTSAGGSASIVAANSSTDSDVQTGDAESANDAGVFTGLNASLLTVVGEFGEAADLEDVDCVAGFGCNIQHGDNRTTANQTARASTGDGVAGQVLGVVSAGATSVDATNRSDDVVVATGDADATNDLASFVGLNAALATGVGGGPITVADVEDVTCVGEVAGCNIQDGDNRRSLSQTADASSGDAVAGQVTGVVTSAGGSASVVVANTSTGIDSTTGDSEFENDDFGFVGLTTTFGPIVIGPGGLILPL